MSIEKLQSWSLSSSQTVRQDHFYVSQWQTDTRVGPCYLMYRIVVAILFLVMFVCSALDIGRSYPQLEYHHAKWIIYMSNWAVIMYVVQAWLAVIIVFRGYRMDRDEPSWDIRVTKDSRLRTVYWIFYSNATVYAFVISIMYWAFIYNPVANALDAVNLMVHLLNSVLMFVDLVVVKHPIRFGHVCWTTGVAVVYSLFSFLYYLAGGTDTLNEPSIYGILNWQEKPGKATVVCILDILLVFIIHCICYGFSNLRMLVHSRIRITKSSSHSSIRSYPSYHGSTDTCI